MSRIKKVIVLLLCISAFISFIPNQAQATTSQLTIGGKRPAIAYLPAVTKPNAPLLISLHGYGSTGAKQESYLKLAEEANKRGVIYVVADGTIDSNGNQFWNAVPACCNFEKTKVDDVLYLTSLISEISKKHSVDSKRIFLLGHSNGGFMSYRVACEASSVVAGVVVIAGAMDLGRQGCKPKKQISILHIHGTSDSVISLDGGVIAGAKYDSTKSAVNFWRKYNSCSTNRVISKINIERNLANAETTRTKYACADGSKIENWEINKGSHVPEFSPNFAKLIFDFLLQVKKG